MKKTLSFLFLSAIIAAGSVFADAKTSVKQEVLFGYRQINNDGKTEGWFIDNEGNVKSYDLNKPLGKIDKSFLSDKYKLIKLVMKGPYSERIGSKGKEGLRKTYFCYYKCFFGLKRREILLKESGDWVQVNNNKNVLEIIVWLEGIESGREQLKQLEKSVDNTK